MTQFVHRLRGYVVINGVRRAFVSASVSSGPDVLVATAQVQLNPFDGLVWAKDAIEIYAGTNTTAPPLIFTGEVGPVDLAHFPRTGQVTCHGPLDRARVKLGLAEGEPLQDEDGNPIPALSFGAASEEAVSVTDGEAVKRLLDAAGVPYDDSAWEETGNEVGAVLPVVVNRGESVLDRIQKIDRDNHCITFDGRDGRARRVRFSGLPAAVPNLVYQEGVNIVSAQRQISDREVINRWNITGVASDLFTVSDTVEADSRVSPTTGRPYVPDPPGHNAGEYQSDGLETADQVVEWGQAELAITNRLEETVQGKLPVIAPALAGGESAQLFYPSIGLGEGQVGWLSQVNHRLEPSSFTTDFTLKASYAAEGTGTNIKPQAAFVWVCIRKATSDGGRLYVVFCDASGSTDPDGAYDIPPTVNDDGQTVPGTSFNGIALYQWESSSGTLVSTGDDGKTAIFVFTANPTGETITLTVTDMQGAEASATQTIAFTDQKPLRVRDVWVAINTDLLFSEDGEVTWQRVGVPAVGCARYAADTFQIAWGEDGTAWKVLADLTYEVLPVTGVTAAYITWSFPAQTVAGTRIWLGCADGSLYFSGDAGASFALAGTVPTDASSITTIGESAYTENQLQATGRNKIFRSFDGGPTWQVAYAHPNTNLIAFAADAGFNVGLAVFHGDPPSVDPGLEASRIQERDNLIEGDWVREATLFDLPAGTWRVAYSYRGAGGETALSPMTSVIIAGTGFVARIAPLNPLPEGATGVYYYASTAPGLGPLRRFAEGSGFLAVDLDAPAPVGGVLPPTANSTLQGIADPTTGPIVVTAAAAAEAPVDFPAQPTAISISHNDPIAYVTGTSQDGSYQVWTADIDEPFTLKRATYDEDFGHPNDVVADQFFRGLALGAAYGAVFQTVDDFRTTIYETLVIDGVGEIGLRIGLGALHTLTPVGNLIWVGSARNRASGSAYVYRLTAEGITRVVHPITALGLVAGQNIPLLKSDLGTLFTYGHTSEVLGGGRGMSHTGTAAWRSTDGGITWDQLDTIENLTNMQTQGTTIYATGYKVPGDAFAGHNLWRSDDDGLTWALVDDIGVSATIPSVYAAVAVDPNDGMRVAIKGVLKIGPDHDSGAGPGESFHLSTNGGVSWTYTGYNAADQANLARGENLAFGPDGTRLVWFSQDATAHYSRYGDLPTGSMHTNTTALQDLNALPFLHFAGDIYSYGESGIQASPDGLAWEAVLDAARVPGHASNIKIHSFVPGDASNAWFALPLPDLDGVALLMRPKEADAGDVWVDATAELLASFPDQLFYAYREAAVRLSTEEAP